MEDKKKNVWENIWEMNDDRDKEKKKTIVNKKGCEADDMINIIANRERRCELNKRIKIVIC